MKRLWGLGLVVGAVSVSNLGSLGCDTGISCNDSQCGGSSYSLVIRGPDLELPPGTWVVTASIEDGTYEAICEVESGLPPTDCEGAWSVPPTRDFDARVAFFPTFVEAGEDVQAEAQLTVSHAEMGPDVVKFKVEIDDATPQTATYNPTYEPRVNGEEGCPECPGSAGDVLELSL
ncbi:MAG: hypothetical protein AAF721_42545 [Myxococcota bacterium]